MNVVEKLRYAMHRSIFCLMILLDLGFSQRILTSQLVPNLPSTYETVNYESPNLSAAFTQPKVDGGRSQQRAQADFLNDPNLLDKGEINRNSSILDKEKVTNLFNKDEIPSTEIDRLTNENDQIIEKSRNFEVQKESITSHLPTMLGSADLNVSDEIKGTIVDFGVKKDLAQLPTSISLLKVGRMTEMDTITEHDLANDHELQKAMHRTTVRTRDYGNVDVEVPTTATPTLQPLIFPEPAPGQVPFPVGAIPIQFGGLPMIPVRLRTTTTATTTPSSIGFTRPIESNLLRGGDQQLEQIGCGWDFLTQRCKDIFQLGWCNACVDIGNVFFHDCRCTSSMLYGQTNYAEGVTLKSPFTGTLSITLPPNSEPYLGFETNHQSPSTIFRPQGDFPTNQQPISTVLSHVAQQQESVNSPFLKRPVHQQLNNYYGRREGLIRLSPTKYRMNEPSPLSLAWPSPPFRL